MTAERFPPVVITPQTSRMLLIGHHETHLCQGDLGDQGIEALAMRGAGCGAPQVVVKAVDGLVGPASLAGTLVECVRQPQARLMAQHLMRS
jgi:hypothetical protein